MPLQYITDQVLYLPGANNIGVVTTGDSGAILIDTGLDKDIARKLRKELDAAGLTLRAIVNTHHHADHIGGNDYLVRNLPDVAVYAPPFEAMLVEYPTLEPTFLNYGATPPRPLQSRWLMAKGVPVQHLLGDVNIIVTGGSQSVTIAGVPFELIGLPGHTMAQVGLVIDGVCLAADGFFGTDIVAKHGVLYAHNVAAQLATFERLMKREERWFLPGHGSLVSRAELADVLAINRTATLRASELAWAAAAKPSPLEMVAARVFAQLQTNGTVSDGTELALISKLPIPQYVVFVGAISAHLSYLEGLGRVELKLGDTGLVWQQTSDS